MIKQHLKSFFVLFIITVIISTSFVNAQSTLTCPYTFTKDLEIGSTGEEVRLLQKILNSDKRTVFVQSGPGSPGNETTTFSDETVESLMRFQALYPDFIGLVDGKLGNRTRTVINAICNRSMNSTPTKDLRISLSANLNAVQMGNSFKVIINSSSELQKFAAENLIIDGGEMKEIRKLSKTSYVAMVISLEGFKKVSIQVEAEGLMSIDGIKNENASNEILVKIIIPTPVATTSTVSTTINTDTDSFTALLNKIVSSVPNCTYNSSGQLITGEKLNTAGCATTNVSTNNQNNQVQYKDCYGQQIPSTQQCPYDPYRAQQQYQQQQYQNQLAQQQAQQRYQQGLGGFGGSGAGGLSGLIESLLKSKSFGGGNNSSAPAANTYIPPAPQPKTPAELAAEKEAADKITKAAEEKTRLENEAKANAEKELKGKIDACSDQACKDKLKQEEDARVAKEKAEKAKAEAEKGDADSPKSAKIDNDESLTYSYCPFLKLNNSGNCLANSVKNPERSFVAIDILTNKKYVLTVPSSLISKSGLLKEGDCQLFGPAKMKKWQYQK